VFGSSCELKDMVKIAHIINPAKVSESSDLHFAQPVTFETMRVAKQFAQATADVQLFTTQYAEDRAIIPPFYQQLPDLARSVLDIRSFKNKRKFPLIKDILQALYDATDADYLIYTNSDIALMPQFYAAVQKFIAMGYDAYIINRRRVSKKYKSVDDIPKMWSDVGASHPGFDCFVLHRSLFPKFILENVCVGVPFVEAALAYNIFAFSKNYKLFTDQHLTIHIGMEVMPERDTEYHQYNQAEFNKIYAQLRPHLSSEKLPYSELPFYQKAIKWGLNPAVFILPHLEIEAEGRWEKLKFSLNEIRWRWLAR